MSKAVCVVLSLVLLVLWDQQGEVPTPDPPQEEPGGSVPVSFNEESDLPFEVILTPVSDLF